MAARFISAVALYGPKTGAARSFLAGVQALIAEHLGAAFRPYTLEQVHGTLIALNAARDPDTGAIVNEYFLTLTGARREMDLPRVMDILAARFADPLRVRFGGFARDQEVPFASRGQHLFDRGFSGQGNAFVLVGWPVSSLAGPARPLDELRREMNEAGLLHRYQAHATDRDNDLHMVVGHHAGVAADALERAVRAVRERLAAHPVELDIGIGDVKIVAADSHTLAPPLFVSGIPADVGVVRSLQS
jgi:hypothetical protein